VRVEEPGPERYDDLVDLSVARMPKVGRPLFTWQFEAPEAFPWIVRRMAVDDDGRLLGWGFVTHRAADPEGWFMANVTVDAAAEGSGAGSALAAALRAELPADVVRISARTTADEVRSLEIAAHWGLLVQQRSISSRLPLVDLPEPAPPPGVTIEDASDLAFSDEAAVETMLRASLTNPEARAGQVITLAGQRVVAAAAEHWLTALVRVNGAPAAICTGDLDMESRTLFIGYTGVDPVFRGRGLARLAKQWMHRAGADRGATVAQTTNAEHNAGIRALNAELGYEVDLAWVWLYRARD